MADSKKTPESQEFKVPITYLPYMGEKKEERIPPPTQRSRENKDVRMLDRKNGGTVNSASSRADGIATRGKTRGKII
jgi:hypothetical protein